MYLAGLFLYFPITHVIESSHDQTPDPNQEKSINRYQFIKGKQFIIEKQKGNTKNFIKSLNTGI